VSQTIDNKESRIVQAVRELERDSFAGVLEEQIDQLIEGHQETLTNEPSYLLPHLSLSNIAVPNFRGKET
jgi:hypothetical protein